LVVKLGGSVIDKADSTVQDVLALTQKGWSIVIIHGGGKLVSQWLSEMGHKTEFINGERVTDKKTLEVVTAILCGLANKQTTASFCAAGLKAVGISGVDGALVQSKTSKKSLGFVGEITQINPSIIHALLERGFIPVVSPVSYNTSVTEPDDPLMLNINGDTVAGEIAKALQANILVFLTDVDGIKNSDGATQRTISTKHVLNLIAQKTAFGGMIPKLLACENASNAGVICRIVDGRKKNALIRAIENPNEGSTISSTQEQ